MAESFHEVGETPFDIDKPLGRIVIPKHRLLDSTIQLLNWTDPISGDVIYEIYAYPYWDRKETDNV